MITILKLIKFDEKKKGKQILEKIGEMMTNNIIIPSTYSSKRNVMIKH